MNDIEKSQAPEDTNLVENVAPDQVESNEQPTPDVKPPKKKSNKKLAMLIIGILLILGAGVAAYLVIKKPAQNTGDQKSETAQQNVSNSGFFGPTLVYAKSSHTQEADCLSTTETQITRGIEDTKISAEMQLPKGAYISSHAVYKNNVAFVAEAGCGSDAKLAVHYSSNGGRTFDVVFEGSSSSDKNLLGDQVTSIVFSSDGKTLVFALLPGAGGSNKVKSIDLNTKKVTDLFTAETAGVFLEAYDSSKQNLYYFTGCYNCDGNTRNKLFVRDLKTNQESTVFEDSEKIGMQAAISSDFKKLLLSQGVAGEFLGAGPPYTITEFDISTKAATKLITSNENIVDLGYRIGDDLPYYIAGNKILNLKGTGDNAVIFEAKDPINQLYYISTTKILADTGDYTSARLFIYDVVTKAIKDLETTNQDTRVFGLATE